MVAILTAGSGPCAAGVASSRAAAAGESRAAAGSTSQGTSTDAALVKAVVRAQKLGPMPYLFRAGLFLYMPLIPEYVRDRFLQDLQPGAVEIDIGKLALRDSRSLEDIPARLALVDDLARRVAKAGGRVVISLTRMPAWLSSSTDVGKTIQGESDSLASVSPPRSAEEWARLVETVVRHFREAVGPGLRYKIWSEPDFLYWRGSEEQYFELYRAAVLGARRADPHARLGGPAVSNPYNPHSGSSEPWPPMLQRFIAWCGRTPVPELGLRRVPIDFLVWHLYSGFPTSSYDVPARLGRAWLSEAGYAENTEILVGEWASWEAFPSPTSPETDTPESASYIVATLIGMEHAGIDLHNFTSLLEMREPKDTQFGGGFGLFTRAFVAKAAYNGLRAMRLLGDMRLAVQNDDPLVAVAAGARQGGGAAVVANFVPGRKSLARGFLDALIAAGFSTTQIASYLGDLKNLYPLMEGTMSLDSLKLSPEVHRRLEPVLERARLLQRLATQRRGSPLRIRVAFEGVEPQPGLFCDVYRIDARNANAYGSRDKVEAAFSSEALRAIQQEVSAQLPELLAARGFSAADIELLKQFKSSLGSGLLSQELARLPAEEQKRVLAMILAYQSLLQERVARISEEVNGWPEVTLRSVESRGLATSSNPVSVEVTLEPHAVAALVLRRRSE